LSDVRNEASLKTGSGHGRSKAKKDKLLDTGAAEEVTCTPTPSTQEAGRGICALEYIYTQQVDRSTERTRVLLGGYNNTRKVSLVWNEDYVADKD
jgi:hypothetical protein